MAARTADALIVGGGLMGCATAYELARRGVRTTLVERNPAPGQETTARSGAIIRAHYGVPELVTLALEANKRYARFADEVGLPCGWTPCGYGVLVDGEDEDALRANVAMQQALGVDVSLIAPDDFQSRVPALKVHDIALVAWEPGGGYADPARTVAAYASCARDLGADLRFGTPVTAATRRGDEWEVTLGDGETLTAPRVALCTGNWSRPVGALFGLELPVTPVRAQIAVLERPPSFAGPFPVVSDLVNLAYFRADGDRGMWVGSSDMADLGETLARPEGYQEAADPPAVESARHKAALRFEGMGAVGVQRAFCGLYETTPDWQPIIDDFGDGLHAAVGFSGHGFKLAPVIGPALADRMTGTASLFDLSLFGVSRFSEGRPIRSRVAYRRARFLR